MRRTLLLIFSWIAITFLAGLLLVLACYGEAINFMENKIGLLIIWLGKIYED